MNITQIDLATRLIDVTVGKKNYTLDFDLYEHAVVITSNSMEQLPISKRHKLTKLIEQYVLQSPEYKKYCKLFK